MDPSDGPFPQHPDITGVVIFNRPALATVREEARRRGCTALFLVVSASLARTSDIEAEWRRELGDALVGVKVGVGPNSPWEDTLAIAAALRRTNADCLVTIGGGSMSDCGKLARLALANHCDTPASLSALRAVIDHSTGRLSPPPGIAITPPTIPFICVPTSLSAGEYNGLAGGTSPAGVKHPFAHPAANPDVVVADPTLALRTPARVWLSTGVRSLDHAVEALCGLHRDAWADANAEDAIPALMTGLLRCSDDITGVDVAARAQCQVGAWKAAQAVTSGIPMGASHAISHALGPVAGVPHGVTSCVLLPAALAYNARVNHDRQALVLDIIRRAGILEKLGLGGDGAAELSLGRVIRVFVERLGLPSGLREVGVRREMFDEIVRETLRDFWSATNPIPLVEGCQVREVLEMAWEGGGGGV